MTTQVLIEELVAAWKTNDAYRASAFFCDAGSYQKSGRDALVGRETILEAFTRFFRDGPQWRFEVDDMVVDDDRAAVAFRFATKTPPGEWQERAGCAMVQCENGRILRWREYH